MRARRRVGKKVLKKVQSRSDHQRTTAPPHRRSAGEAVSEILLHLLSARVASHAKRVPGHAAQTPTPTARGGRGPLPRRSPWRRGSAPSAIEMRPAEMAAAAPAFPPAAEINPRQQLQQQRQQRAAAVAGQAASASATCCRTSARITAATARLGASSSTPPPPLAEGPSKRRAGHPRWLPRDALLSGGPGDSASSSHPRRVGEEEPWPAPPQLQQRGLAAPEAPAPQAPPVVGTAIGREEVTMTTRVACPATKIWRARL